MSRHWFFTWRTYGSWLPGEDGFVGFYQSWDGRRVKDNTPGLPATASIPALARYAEGLLAVDTVLLDRGRADAVLKSVLEHAPFRSATVDAVAVLTNHAHLVFETQDDIDMDRSLADWKAYASRALNRIVLANPDLANPERGGGLDPLAPARGSPRPGSPARGSSGRGSQKHSRPLWWAEKGSTRVLADDSSRVAAIVYVRDQVNPHVVWLSETARELTASL